MGVFVITLALGGILGRQGTESAAIGLCITLSSTTVAISSLTKVDSETSYGRALIALLLSQDIFLGVIVAILPLYADASRVGRVISIEK